MSRKNTHIWTALNAVDMSSNQTSEITDVQNTDNIGYLVTWSGTSPVGQLLVEVSNDKAVSPTVWTALSFGSSIEISGNSGSHDININQLPFAKIRVRYARASGTGSLTVVMTQKQVGG